MSSTLQKVEQASILLAQAQSSQEMPAVFKANLNSFVEAARSITWIMQKEFAGKEGFQEWYAKKQADLKADKECGYFSELRTDTTHITPFSTPQRITMEFISGGLTIAGGSEAIIPIGRVSEYGTIIPADNEPITVNGKKVHGKQRSTSITYQFSDRPGENAVDLCTSYLDTLTQLAKECLKKFSSQ